MSTITQAKPSSLEQEFTDDVYILTPEEEMLVEQGIKSLDAGLGIPYEVFHMETQEWLGSLKQK